MGHSKKRAGYKIVWGLVILVGLIFVSAVYFQNHPVAVLQPKGVVGQKEKQLIIIGVLLSTLVVIPVFVMTAVIAYKYRETNSKAKYTPDWDRSRFYETVWWGIPIIIISVLSLITWNSAHALDPSKPLVSNVKPMTIQVISLDWKWLFIYPQQNIATVNFLEFPVNTPLNFEITSDSVMNSFWVPQLGGQIYAMPGMATQLHLMADQVGDFNGSSANISGSGFSGMTFTARSATAADFIGWLSQVKQAPAALTQAEYTKLAKPSKNNPPVVYSTGPSSLFSTVILKYMMPVSQIRNGVGLPAMGGGSM
jgi:cytochrome o ubiquinol oxidase subunit 2